jgi:hypothetical protein
MLKLILPILLLTACGGVSNVSQPSLTPPLKQQLQAQVDRIMPQLEFCGGVVSKPNCDIGDAGLFHSLYASKQNNAALVSAYKTIPESIFCRSFEMAYLGPKIMQIKFGVGNPYSCDALQKNAEFQAQKNLTGFNAKIAAETLKPGYRLHLLAVNGYARYLTNSVNAEWADVLDRLHRRQPENLFFDFLSNATHSGSQERFELVATKLLIQARQWPGNSRRTQWSFERSDAEQAWKDSMGHELVYLSKLLIGGTP